MGRRAVALALAVAVLGAGTAWWWTRPQPREGGGWALANLLGGDDNGGYARVATPDRPRLPADHGPHPDFRSEWWYFTGPLATESGRRFGVQLTFFRFSMAASLPEPDSPWAARSAWMAHLALSDVATGGFHSEERFGRGALGLAGARAVPFSVWLHDWQAASTGEDFLPLTLRAAAADFGVDLVVEAGRGPVMQGDDGYSPKGPEAGNASLYYSYTRLPASGRLVVSGEEHAVSGALWMDREWSTSTLGPGVEGWDWFSLQLDDGRDLMFYRLRREDGTATSFSAGLLVGADGGVRRLAAAEVEAEPLSWWTSPDTGTRYPVAWRLIVPGHRLSLTLRAALPDQEMDHSVHYWEGLVEAEGEAGGRPVRGAGYLEMTGYD